VASGIKTTNTCGDYGIFIHSTTAYQAIVKGAHNMPHIQCKELWRFSELSNAAKERARNEYLNGVLESDMWNCVLSYVIDAAKYIGIAIGHTPLTFVGGGTRQVPAIAFSRDSVKSNKTCFAGKWSAETVSPLAALKEAFPKNPKLYRIHTALKTIALRHPDACAYITHTGPRALSSNTTIDTDFGRNQDKNDTVYEKDEITLERTFLDFMNWVSTQLVAEYDLLTSDRHIDVSLRANTYEFLENGTRA
jgi:hypothetical protein